MSSDPVRLRDEASGASARVRSLFAAGVEDVPRPEEVRRLASKLLPLLVIPADGAATAASVGVGAKLGLAAAVAVGLAVGVVWHRGSTTAAPPATPATTQAPRAPSGSEHTENAPAENAPGPSAPVENGAAAEPTSTPSTEPSARAGGASAAQARPAETEAALLERARRALSTSPARALALCDQHRATFPSGVLAQEREVIAIEALKRLGRADAAAKRAADFSRRYPGSAYQKKLGASPP